MSQQRLILFFSSVAGIISFFFPWQVLPFSEQVVNGLHGYGWVVFACLVIAGLAAVVGQRSHKLGRLLRLVCLVAGLCGSALMIIFLAGFSDEDARQNTGYAPYLTAVACLGVLAAAFFYKPEDIPPPKDNWSHA